MGSMCVKRLQTVTFHPKTNLYAGPSPLFMEMRISIQEEKEGLCKQILYVGFPDAQTQIIT